MTYTVLARRYRSRSFDQVVGQEPIAQTLKNAIATGRVAHAFLFNGTRGVGKTSMARIFATALNAPATVEGCPEPADPEGLPDVDVQQRMAQAIMRGEDLNVIEIDGASNNRVEEVRQLIANAGLSPTGQARHKVYIIDEVHMLSTAAFNALLKTMEEPPPHVKFILCTTEPHKVPATIHSRCQRFDFKNIATGKIVEHLKGVMSSEKVPAQEQALWQVARMGRGSMRDALSIVDRLIAGVGPQADGQPTEGVTQELVERVLGLPPQQMLTRLINALADGDIAESLGAVGELIAHGIEGEQLVETLIERLRQLMLIRACGADSDLIELAEEDRQAAAAQSERFDTPGLVHMIALCESLLRHTKSSASPRALLDAAVVRMALAEKMADVAGLLAGASSTSGDGKRPAPKRPTAPMVGEKKNG